VTTAQLITYALLVALPAAMYAGWTLRKLYAEHNLDVQARVDAYTFPASHALVARVSEHRSDFAKSTPSTAADPLPVVSLSSGGVDFGEPFAGSSSATGARSRHAMPTPVSPADRP
jgi:hypothetical protein